MSLERFCRKSVAQAGTRATVRQLAEQMREQHVGSLVIVDEGNRPVGMVTDRDICIRIVADALDPGAMTAEQVMSSPVVTVRSTARIDEAAFKIRDSGVRRLPVIDAEGAVCGLVSVDDLVVLFSAELGQTVQAVRENKGP